MKYRENIVQSVQAPRPHHGPSESYAEGDLNPEEQEHALKSEIFMKILPLNYPFYSILCWMLVENANQSSNPDP